MPPNRRSARSGTGFGNQANALLGSCLERDPLAAVAELDSDLWVTDDMLHTVLRRKAAGERVEDIRKNLIIPTGKRKGENPSLASIYRALAEHEKTQAYPEAVEAAHADFALLQGEDIPRPRPAHIRRPGQALTAQEAELRQRPQSHPHPNAELP